MTECVVIVLNGNYFQKNTSDLFLTCTLFENFHRFNDNRTILLNEKICDIQVIYPKIDIIIAGEKITKYQIFSKFHF